MKMEQLNELALFAGAGGGILGGKLLGWQTVCAVEFNTYAASVLLQRQNDGLLPPFPVWDDVCTFDGRPWRGIVDVVSGGFPCQDISAAGKGAGITGDKSGLWKEFARIIREVRPRFAFVENSPVLTSRGIDTVLGDLAALGYDAEWGVLGAAEVGAPHLRERIWIVAYSFKHMRDPRRPKPAGQQWPARPADGCHDVENSRGEGPWNISKETDTNNRRRARGNEQAFRQTHRKDGADRVEPAGGVETDMANSECSEWGQKRGSCDGLARENRIPQREESAGGAGKCGEDFPDTTGPRLPQRESGTCWQVWNKTWWPEPERRDWWQSEPDVGRVANGVAARVDRLTAIGNGQVPQCAAEAWRRLIKRMSGNAVDSN